MRNIIILTVSILLSSPFTMRSQESDSEVIDHVPGQMMVLLKNKVDVQKWCSDLREQGVADLAPDQRLSQSMNLWLVSYDPSAIADQDALLKAERSRAVTLAQFNHTNVTIRNTPNDPEFEDQWSLYNDGVNGGSGTADIDALQAWDISTGGTTAHGDSIVVAVIDGGYAMDHEDLVDNYFTNHNEIPGNGIDDDANGYIDDVQGWNAYTNSGTQSTSNHGTHVAGTIGAKGNNAIGVTGVNWDVKILPISGSSGLESTVLVAYSYVLDMRRLYDATNGEKGAYVVSTNASFGVDYGDPADYPLWCAMYDSLGISGVLSAGATANINIDIDVEGDVPTACGSNFLFSVTNMTSSDVKNSGAAYGVTTIDLGAPGTSIRSTTFSGYGNLTGTSMATPHVAGAIGLMYSAICPEIMDAFSGQPAQLAFYVRNKLLFEGVDELASLDGLVVTGGRLNLYKAVTSVVDTCAEVIFTEVPSGCGNCDGSLSATVVGGQSPFQYEWSNSETSQIITDLCPGVYDITVVDVNGDTFTASGTVSDSTGPVLTTSTLHVNCAGGNDGSISVSGAISYAWSNNATTANVSDLEAGEYVVTATDANGCSTVESFVINEPKAIEASFIETIPVPYSGSNGQIEAVVSGGVPPYSFNWNTGSTDSLATGLNVGDYELAVEDANGCTETFDFYLGWPTGLPEVEVAEVMAFPNPTSGVITIRSESDLVQVQVMDIAGRVLKEFSLRGKRSEVDISSMATGSYFLVIDDEDRRSIQRIELIR